MRERLHSYKPAPRFFGDGGVYLGVELEVEAPSYQAKQDGLQAGGHPRWAYAKHDGSLGIHGWEMVTHPISLGMWMTSENVRDYHNIPVGTVLTARYKGVTYTATMLSMGEVEWNGTVYSSISAAGKAIRGGKSTNGYQLFGLIDTNAIVNPVASFFRLVAKLREMGYDSHASGRCGFHIHLCRKAFSTTGTLDNPTYFRFKYLINSALFRKLSQRTMFNFCQQEPVTLQNYAVRNTDRYSAVNVTSKTIEVRIFRGNLREERIRKNLEAVIAALEFSRDTASYTAPTEEEFVNYVRSKGDRFQNLVAYIDRLERRGE
jgi:hypothetical protein